MENIIFERAFFLGVMVVHSVLFFGAPLIRKHIPFKTLTRCFFIELGILVGVMVCSCFMTPMYNGVLAAIFGYLFVLFVVAGSYMMLLNYIVVPEKEYIMLVTGFWKKDGQDEIVGKIWEYGIPIYVRIQNKQLSEEYKVGKLYYHVKFKEFTSEIEFRVIVEPC